MASEKLNRARGYEEAQEKKIREEERPVFHMSPRTGWLNDPNGLSWYNGAYHLFYQYHPYDAHWGPMHWGHAVSSDLLHWEYRPAALAPDMPYDGEGCFSGSAVTLPDGRHMLMYTGVGQEIQEDGSIRGVQTQCLAVWDGAEYIKYEGNPVLDERNLPQGASRYDFRDPKIWRRKDGAYRCVAGNASSQGGGQVLLFASRDGFSWEYQKVLAGDGRFGSMWECPDFFELDGKGVLLLSVNLQGYRQREGSGVVALIGDYDQGTDTFTEQSDQLVDCGMDFYAPQTMVAPDGRRIMIGWMQNLATGGLHSRQLPWFGQLSIPRELAVKEGRLYQAPISEIETLRRGKVEYRSVILQEAISLEGIRGRLVDMELTLDIGSGWESGESVAIRYAQDEKHYTVLKYYPRESLLQIDRQFSGNDAAPRSLCSAEAREGRLKLRLILDRFSAEIFVNDGEQVMTAKIDTEQTADGISFCADRSVLMDVVKYELV